MGKRLFIIVAASVSAACTSISCNYGPTDATDLPIGTWLQTTAPMVGMLDESIDDPKVHYLNITELPGYSNRFVKKRIHIPAGSRFKVVGARKANNVLCWGQDHEVVLQGDTPLESTNAEIHMKLPTALAHRVPSTT